jgi:hypothetical protein
VVSSSSVVRVAVFQVAQRRGVEPPAQEVSWEAGQLKRVGSNGLFGPRRADRTRTRTRTRTRGACERSRSEVRDTACIRPSPSSDGRIVYEYEYRFAEYVYGFIVLLPNVVPLSRAAFQASARTAS